MLISQVLPDSKSLPREISPFSSEMPFTSQTVPRTDKSRLGSPCHIFSLRCEQVKPIFLELSHWGVLGVEITVSMVNTLFFSNEVELERQHVQTKWISLEKGSTWLINIFWTKRRSLSLSLWFYFDNRGLQYQLYLRQLENR